MQASNSLRRFAYQTPALHFYINRSCSTSITRIKKNPSSLTEEEKKARMNRLKPEKKIETHEFDEDEAEITQRSWKHFVTR
ncbi:uncharacterized protein LOC124440060 isoform X2 [Xenia sp. Carnegie-2017]|uniref:uncharacterized protein LOC124440060 isoform X2 n=1 Tax=Xenia sp. Carnegie-2017 TaxID=2897299 RepID=UPI001F04274F|nr:uncharacterized protein LOC124440060 isoform X2 [Xenia sp. Carnegie-2017]